jgi:hypothetical protein
MNKPIWPLSWLPPEHIRVYWFVYPDTSPDEYMSMKTSYKHKSVLRDLDSIPKTQSTCCLFYE